MKNQQGQTLIIAIVFTAILLTLSSALVGYTTLHLRGERQTLAQGQALEIAEAGIDKAIYQLNQSSSYTGETNTNLGGGQFSVTVSTSGNTKTITSTGYVPNSANPVQTKIVKVNVNINTDTIAFNFGVQVGAGGLQMSNNSTVNGNIYSDGNIDGSGTIAGDATVAGGTAPTPDQQWTTQDTDFAFGNSSATSDAAQSFVPSTNINLSKISAYLKKTGNPSDITVKILSNNSGKPSKSVIATGTIAASAVTGNYSFIDAGFTSTPSLNGGQTYWIMLDAPVSAANYFYWGQDTSAGYTAGNGMYSNNWNASTPVWTNAGGDFDFKVYGGGVSTHIQGVTVNGNAKANQLLTCTILGDAFYDSINTCTTGGTQNANQPDPAPQPMPISDAQITDWETNATSGGTVGAQTINGTVSMGPKKINGDLVINGTLNLTGPVWVAGNISIGNNAAITIDAGLGDAGTVLLADDQSNESGSGLIDINNNVDITGNGNPDSVPLVLTTSTNSNAIRLSNNAIGGIFYASAGTIQVANNASAKQLTGYSISLSNNATITYTNGLASADFSNGPGGSWAFVPGTYVILK